MLDDFLGWHTLIFGLVCWILTFFTRRILENIYPSIKKQTDANAPGVSYKTTFSRWWNEVILYAMPAVWGGICAVAAVQYPFPQGISSVSGRLFFGVVVGFFSSFLYKVVKKVALKRFDIVDDTPAPATPDE